MNAWILSARPKTLSAAVAPVVSGTALAFSDTQQIRWNLFVYTLLSAIFIQIGTNLVNDVLDFRRGADKEGRLGPVRVTQAGLLSPGAVLRAAWVSFILAALCGVPLVLRGGIPILIIGLVSIAAAYAYTGGPYPLAYHGLGEPFVILFFGVLAVGGTYYLQTQSINARALLLGLAIGMLATVLLAINNLRDIVQDRAAGKHTVAVRIGEHRARVEVMLLVLIPFAIVTVLALVDWWLALPLLLLPMALFLIVRVMRARGAELNRALAIAGALQLAFAILFAAGAVVGERVSGVGRQVPAVAFPAPKSKPQNPKPNTRHPTLANGHLLLAL